MAARYGIIGMILWPMLLAAAPFPNPWLGRWSLRLADPMEKPETLVYSDAGGGAMRMTSIEDGSLIVTRFDGRPAPDTGAGAASGPTRTLAVRAVTPTRYRWTFAVRGKAVAEGINTLAADGRSFTEVSWRAGAPDRQVTLVYERR